VCTGFNWLGAESCGGRLWERYWTFRFHLGRKILYKYSSPLHFGTRYCTEGRQGPVGCAFILRNLLTNFIPNNVTTRHLEVCTFYVISYNPQATTYECPVLVVYVISGHLPSSVQILLSIKTYAAIICAAFSLRIHWYVQPRSIKQALHLSLQAAPLSQRAFRCHTVVPRRVRPWYCLSCLTSVAGVQLTKMLLGLYASHCNEGPRIV